MRKILAFGGAIALIASAIALPVGAQTNASSTSIQGQNRMALNITPSGRVRIEGQVTAISSSTLSVSSWGGTWTLAVSTNSRVDEEGGSIVPLSQIKTGDTVIANGSMSSSSSMTINVSVLRDISLNTEADATSTVRESLSGRISDLNAALRSFVLNLRNGRKVTVDVNDNANIRIANGTSTITGLQNGEQVHVSGLFNKSDDTLAASRLRAAANLNARKHLNASGSSSLKLNVGY